MKNTFPGPAENEQHSIVCYVSLVVLRISIYGSGVVDYIIRPNSVRLNVVLLGM